MIVGAASGEASGDVRSTWPRPALRSCRRSLSLFEAKGRWSELAKERGSGLDWQSSRFGEEETLVANTVNFLREWLVLERWAAEGVVAAELNAVAVEAAVLLFGALFEAAGDDGVTLGIA